MKRRFITTFWVIAAFIVALGSSPYVSAACGVFYDHPQMYAFCIKNELIVAKNRGEDPGIETHNLPSGLPGMEQIDALKRQQLRNNRWWRQNNGQVLGCSMQSRIPDYVNGGCME